MPAIIKTTNLYNKMYYIGREGTESALLSLERKHYEAREFVTEVLEEYATADDVAWRLSQIITEAFVKDPQTYNIQFAGQILLVPGSYKEKALMTGQIVKGAGQYRSLGFMTTEKRGRKRTTPVNPNKGVGTGNWRRTPEQKASALAMLWQNQNKDRDHPMLGRNHLKKSKTQCSKTLTATNKEDRRPKWAVESLLKPKVASDTSVAPRKYKKRRRKSRKSPGMTASEPIV